MHRHRLHAHEQALKMAWVAVAALSVPMMMLAIPIVMATESVLSTVLNLLGVAFFAAIPVGAVVVIKRRMGKAERRLGRL